MPLRTLLPRTALAALACAGVALLTVAGAGATQRLSKPQYVARADSICAAAHSKIVALAPLYPLARTAKIGDRWLTIDRSALARLRALAPPPGDKAEAARILALADKTVNVGLVGLVRAAKTGSASAYATAGARF